MFAPKAESDGRWKAGSLSETGLDEYSATFHFVVRVSAATLIRLARWIESPAKIFTGPVEFMRSPVTDRPRIRPQFLQAFYVRVRHRRYVEKMPHESK